MGTWDIGPFDNDVAADFSGNLDDLPQDRRAEALRTALHKAATCDDTVAVVPERERLSIHLPTDGLADDETLGNVAVLIVDALGPLMQRLGGAVYLRVEPSVVPMLAIGAFAGLRDAEIKRLDWNEVDLSRGHIEIKAAKAKSARRRIMA